MSDSPHPIGKDELRKKVRDAIGFGSPERIESIGVIGLNLPATRFDEITDQIMAALDAYTIEAEKRAGLKKAIDEFKWARDMAQTAGTHPLISVAYVNERIEKMEAEYAQLHNLNTKEGKA